MTLNQVDLVGDRNANPDPNLDQTETRLNTNKLDVKPFHELIGSLYLVNKFQNQLPQDVV